MHLIGPVTKRAHDKEIIKLEKFVVTGGKALHGEVTISGAKNAAVGILPATILAADVCVIENLPDISDVAVSLKILSTLVVTPLSSLSLSAVPFTVRSTEVPLNV